MVSITSLPYFNWYHAETSPEFNLQNEGEKAYSTFMDALQHKALKMIINT